MKMKAYLKFEGIKGDVTHEGHEGDIEVSSFHFQGSHPWTAGQRRGSGDVTLSDFSITKEVDSASADLLQDMVRGRVYEKVVFTLFTATSTGSGHVEYMVYEFEHVAITSFRWSTAEGDPETDAVEIYTLGFEKVEVTYTEVDSEGNKGGSHVAKWNLLKGSED